MRLNHGWLDECLDYSVSLRVQSFMQSPTLDSLFLFFFLLLSVPKVSPVMYLKTCRCCCCSVFQESGEAAARDADINTVIVFFFTCSWLFMPFLTALSLMGFSSKPHMEHVRPPVRHLKTVQSQQGRPHMSKQQAGLSHLPHASLSVPFLSTVL